MGRKKTVALSDTGQRDNAQIEYLMAQTIENKYKHAPSSTRTVRPVTSRKKYSQKSQQARDKYYVSLDVGNTIFGPRLNTYELRMPYFRSSDGNTKTIGREINTTNTLTKGSRDVNWNDPTDNRYIQPGDTAYYYSNYPQGFFVPGTAGYLYRGDAGYNDVRQQFNNAQQNIQPLSILERLMEFFNLK